MKKYFNKILIMSEEENNFNQVTFAGFMKKLLMMTIKK